MCYLLEEPRLALPLGLIVSKHLIKSFRLCSGLLPVLMSNEVLTRPIKVSSHAANIIGMIIKKHSSNEDLPNIIAEFVAQKINIK